MFRGSEESERWARPSLGGCRVRNLIIHTPFAAEMLIRFWGRVEIGSELNHLGAAMSSEAGQFWIMRDPLRCSGCRLCEVACSLHHEGTVWPEASRIRVYEPAPGVDVPHLCSQCDDYPCVKACNFDALRVDEKTAAVLVDPEKCTLCGACVVACPGRVPRIVPGKSHVLICDLCGGDPECVKACSRAGYNALTLVPRKPSPLHKLYADHPLETARRLAPHIFGERQVV